MSAVSGWIKTDEQAEAVAAYLASNYPSLSTLATYNRKPTNLRDHHLNDYAQGASAGRGAVLNRGVGTEAGPLALKG